MDRNRGWDNCQCILFVLRFDVFRTIARKDKDIGLRKDIRTDIVLITIIAVLIRAIINVDIRVNAIVIAVISLLIDNWRWDIDKCIFIRIYKFFHIFSHEITVQCYKSSIVLLIGWCCDISGVSILSEIRIERHVQDLRINLYLLWKIVFKFNVLECRPWSSQEVDTSDKTLLYSF